MKLQKFTYFMLAVLLLQSCMSGSYEGGATDLLGSEGEQVPVRVSIGDPSGGIVQPSGVQAKGSGPIDDFNQVDGKIVYVYAFNSDLFTSFAKTSEEDMLNTLVDGSIDNSGSKVGKKAVTRAGSRYLSWENTRNELYYHSGSLSHIPYDFYAYYLDDLRVSEDDYIRTDDAVKIRVQIDGRRDLMSAKAEITEEQLRQCAEDERLHAKEYSFSYFTGIRNILPNFYFKHHLACLEFEVIPEYVLGARKQVTVASIKVFSKYKADFVVAEKSHPSQLGLRFDEDYTWLTLSEEDGTDIPDDKYNLQTMLEPEQAPVALPIGGSLLVAPQKDALRALVRLKETDEHGNPIADVENEVMISYTPVTGAYMFAPGNKYKVKFRIFGLTHVMANVTLEPWHKGGDLDVDTENDKPNL